MGDKYFQGAAIVLLEMKIDFWGQCFTVLSVLCSRHSINMQHYYGNSLLSMTRMHWMYFTIIPFLPTSHLINSNNISHMGGWHFQTLLDNVCIHKQLHYHTDIDGVCLLFNMCVPYLMSNKENKARRHICTCLRNLFNSLTQKGVKKQVVHPKHIGATLNGLSRSHVCIETCMYIDIYVCI